MIPRITPHNPYQVKVEFPYDPEAVKQIKAEIPGPGRKWDGKNKCWIVENDFADYALDVLTNVFGSIVDVDEAVMEGIRERRKHEEGKS